MVCSTPHTLSPNTLSPHTLSPNTLSPHTLSPHTLSPHTLSPHTLSPDALSPDTLSPDTLTADALRCVLNFPLSFSFATIFFSKINKINKINNTSELCSQFKKDIMSQKNKRKSRLPEVRAESFQMYFSCRIFQVLCFYLHILPPRRAFGKP